MSAAITASVYSSLSMANDVEGIRISEKENQTRIVFDLSEQASFKTGFASNPSRYFVDIAGGRVDSGLTRQFKPTKFVSGLRTGSRNDASLRIVFDLTRPLHATATIVDMDRKNNLNHRLVIDLVEPGRTTTGRVNGSVATPVESKIVISKRRPDNSRNIPTASRGKPLVQKDTASAPVPLPAALPVTATTTVDAVHTTVAVAQVPQANANAQQNTQVPVERTAANAVPPEPRIIVIDPGHGGRDSGAVGRKKTYEKDIVLAIGKLVAAEVNKIDGYKAIMTRQDDTYIKLRDRAEIARRNNAFAFISIHADGSTRKSARGSSVYSLTDGESTSKRTKKLAEHLNANDIVAGDGVNEEAVNDRNLVKTLLALSTGKTQELGYDLGTAILGELKKITPAHIPTVEKANFRVLLAPGVPTILVETGFITNPKEEKKIRSKQHQKATANAIVSGLRKFLKENESKLTNAEGPRPRG